jgi:hypothetical protein
MEMYRRVRELQDSMHALQGALRSATLGDDTRTITTHADEAQALTDRLLRSIENVLKGRDADIAEESAGVKLERHFVRAAGRSLGIAWSGEERVGAAGSAADMRKALFDVKTHVDFADAYLRAALGLEEAE